MPAVFPAWPGRAGVAVVFTFDVDGEPAWLGEGPQNGRQLTLLSQAAPARRAAWAASWSCSRSRSSYDSSMTADDRPY
ncbi:MAG TPA: hypothetical protein VEF71_13415 [Streptosporangiaceae bacterium]|nr:hypothetical protein [Streptosporangiaceae bacterium]